MDFRDVISIISAICAVVFAYLAFFRNHRKDERDDAGHDATIMAEIGYIKANTDEIKTEQREMRKDYVDIVTRLVANETDIKNAVRRIERLEGVIKQ